MAGMDDWAEIDAFIDEGREVQAVRAIWEKLGCPLPEAYRLFHERAATRRAAREQTEQ